MIPSFRNIPIKRKILVAIIVTSGAALLLAGTGIVIGDQVLFRRRLERDLSTITQIIADNSTTALNFGDAQSASRILSALKEKPHTVSACIYRADGTVLARYSRKGTSGRCAVPSPGDEVRLSRSDMTVTHVVFLNGRRAGSVVLVYDLGEVDSRIKSFSTTVLVLVVIASLIALLLLSGLRRQIVSPVLSLAGTAKAVSETRDYSIRAEKVSNDELGGLVEAFNEMLANIQSRDEQLRRVRDELEERVRERTEQLRQSEERFRLLVDKVEDYAIFMLNPNGTIATWNAGAERIYRYTASEIIGQHFARFFTEEDREQGKPRMEILEVNVEGRAQQEQWRVRKDGTPFWASVVMTALRDSEGHLVGFSKITRDLTERKRAEETLREQASLLDLAHDAIIVRDLKSQITFWNHGAEETYGWSREEALGRKLFEFLKTESSRPLDEIEAEVLKTRHWHGELVHTSRSGRRISVVSRWALQSDGNGRPRAVLQINTDITERKRAEEELQQYAQELARSNADLQQFAYVASHDLQEPLRMVISYMQILSDEYKGKLDADADEFIGYAVEGANRMRQLISDLLAYCRVGTDGHPRVATDCGSVLNQVRSNLEMAIRENGCVITSDPLPTIMADPWQVLQLFQNLVGNAIKFHGQEPPRIHVSARRDGAEWVFSVADNGIGIDSAYYDRIFVIFQRLHDRMTYSGTGMGLAICKRIVDRLGGRIWLKSSPGKGSTFYFSVPASI